MRHEQSLPNLLQYVELMVGVHVLLRRLLIHLMFKYTLRIVAYEVSRHNETALLILRSAVGKLSSLLANCTAPEQVNDTEQYNRAQ